MTLDLIKGKHGFVGPTFSAKNRIRRLVWQLVWMACARWTLPTMHTWRIFLLRCFGAKVSYRAYVYADVQIWAPWNLVMDDYATLARGVICYNVAEVTLGARAVVSQFTHVCTASHDYRDPAFPLFAKPICIGPRAWVCAGSFVGPGVSVGDGAILSAHSVTHQDLEPWRIYRGNPAIENAKRPMIHD